MASTSEIGHAKNAANFQDLIAFVTSFGATYNPSKVSLKIPQLNTLSTTAQGKLADVVTKNTSYNNSINERMNSFSGLRGFSTRLVNALATTNASKEKIADAKGFHRKIQGKRSSAMQVQTDLTASAPANISASQQSYDQLIQHFAGLISVLQSEASYIPNENELKLTALTAKHADLVAKNSAVATAYATVSGSRILRNKTLYDETIGLVDTAKEVKKYVKSAYGATSQEFDLIKGIQFTKLKR